MAPPSPLSPSPISTALTAATSTSYDAPLPSHLAVAAVLARSASAYASTLGPSYLATTASSIASTPYSTPMPPRTISWYSVPNSRGTWQLLITCLITINLCVWTAIHLNIPAKVDKAWPLKERIWSNYYCRRVRWVLLGLLAPELVVYTAWMQWESARYFVTLIKALREHNLKTGTEIPQRPHFENTEALRAESHVISDELPDDYPRSISQDHAITFDVSGEITMTHGFYAGMGSYHIDLDVPDEPKPSQLCKFPIQEPDGRTKRSGSLQPKAEESQRTSEYPTMVNESNSSIRRRCSPTRLWLTAKGVLALIEADKLSLPSKDTIADRSKSDLLAKTLVCL
jgi:hypothetical protein